MSHGNINNDQYSSIIKRSTLITLFTVLFLIGIKFFAWWMTGSIVILGTLADSFFDFAITFINLILVRFALEPADSEHRWGHARLEAVTALLEGVLIVLASIYILFLAIQRYFLPETIEHTGYATIVMVVSIIVTFLLVRYQSEVIKKTSSLSATAEHTHYLQDLLTNFSALVAIVLIGNFGFTQADSLFGSLIAIYMIYTSYGILKKSIDVLIDREIDDDIRDEVRSIIMKHPKVDGIHDFKTRMSGGAKERFFMQCHLEVSRYATLIDAHSVSDEVEEMILKRFPDAEVICHLDPSGIEEERTWHD